MVLLIPADFNQNLSTLIQAAGDSTDSDRCSIGLSSGLVKQKFIKKYEPALQSLS